MAVGCWASRPHPQLQCRCGAVVRGVLLGRRRPWLPAWFRAPVHGRCLLWRCSRGGQPLRQSSASSQRQPAWVACQPGGPPLLTPAVVPAQANGQASQRLEPAEALASKQLQNCCSTAGPAVEGASARHRCEALRSTAVVHVMRSKRLSTTAHAIAGGSGWETPRALRLPVTTLMLAGAVLAAHCIPQPIH